MKRKFLSVLLFLSLTVTGCGWPGGSYVSVEPHQSQQKNVQPEAISASNYGELYDALREIVASGAETVTIQVRDYPEETIQDGMERAIRSTMQNDPIGAYAVEDIQYELGTTAGQPAAAVTVYYRHGRSELQKIQTVKSEKEAQAVITGALERLESSVVLLKPGYAVSDVTQLVQDFAGENPQKVMEIPQVTQTVYGTGTQQILELIFTYQTDRDALRRMQLLVQPVFRAAELYVSGDDAERQKFAQLYAFLMERFDYKLETSITPAYSLLRHGVGDSRAFATVYAAMCHSADLTCMVVTGTHAGEPWTWNVVIENGYYYHVDLIRSSTLGGYRTFTDAEMSDYVWDYSAYPECTGAPLETGQPSDEAPADASGQEQSHLIGEETEAPQTVPPDAETVPEQSPLREIAAGSRAWEP